jgi:hypothetical protein
VWLADGRWRELGRCLHAGGTLELRTWLRRRLPGAGRAIGQLLCLHVVNLLQEVVNSLIQQTTSLAVHRGWKKVAREVHKIPMSPTLVVQAQEWQSLKQVGKTLALCIWTGTHVERHPLNEAVNRQAGNGWPHLPCSLHKVVLAIKVGEEVADAIVRSSCLNNEQICSHHQISHGHGGDKWAIGLTGKRVNLTIHAVCRVERRQFPRGQDP